MLKKSWYKLRDNVRFSYNKWRYDFKACALLNDFSFNKIKHIVVSKMDGKLGDSQVITPFFTEINKYFPEIKFSVLCSANVAPIYKQCLNITNTIVLPKKPQKDDLIKAVDAINNYGKCDLLVTTEPNFRARDFILEHLLKPTYTAGFEGRAACVNINLLQRNYGKHISNYFKDLLILGGISNPDMSYLPLITQESYVKLNSLLENKSIYGLAPYGASKHRKLSDKTIIDTLDYCLSLNENNYVCVLTVKEDRAILEKISPKYGQRLIVLPLDLNSLDLAFVISKLKVLISVDTANVHLACASKTPLFALYSGLDSDGIKRWGPFPLFQKARTFFIPQKLIESLTFDDFKQDLAKFLQTFNLSN